jgi:hypothetical protein
LISGSWRKRAQPDNAIGVLLPRNGNRFAQQGKTRLMQRFSGVFPQIFYGSRGNRKTSALPRSAQIDTVKAQPHDLSPRFAGNNLYFLF